MVSEGFFASVVVSTYAWCSIADCTWACKRLNFAGRSFSIKACICCFALQTLPHQTWIRWNFLSCVMVCAGTCRIFPSPSSPPHYMLRWSTLPKVRAHSINDLFFTVQKTNCWRNVPSAIEHSVLWSQNHKNMSVPFGPSLRHFYCSSPLLSVQFRSFYFVYHIMSQVQSSPIEGEKRKKKELNPPPYQTCTWPDIHKKENK